jgi:hypothetical protein
MRRVATSSGLDEMLERDRPSTPAAALKVWERLPPVERLVVEGIGNGLSAKLTGNALGLSRGRRTMRAARVEAIVAKVGHSLPGPGSNRSKVERLWHQVSFVPRST